MIIAEQTHGTWTAWQEHSPCLSFGGDEPATAVSRLCESEGIDLATLACRYSKVTRDRMEFVTASGPCPDCGGSGQYVGLSEVEDCSTCCGGGRV